MAQSEELDIINKAVYELVSQVPSGKITTYGLIARALGDNSTVVARAVGRILASNPKPIQIPCHRVIHADGSLGGYRLGTSKKAELLLKEGINIEGGKAKALNKILFKKFRSFYPLKKLREAQIKLSKNVVLQDVFDEIKYIGGLDVTYFDNIGIGVAVVFDYSAKTLVEHKIVKSEVVFPYISTYLSFREFPIIKEVVELLSHKPQILMLDGNGVLHPFCIGVASHAGIKLNIATIGVAKSLLCGKVQCIPTEKGKSSEIIYKSKLAGYCLKSAKNANPIYVSPGHKISFDTALEIVKKFCCFRIPEPIRVADKIGRMMRDI